VGDWETGSLRRPEKPASALRPRKIATMGALQIFISKMEPYGVPFGVTYGVSYRMKECMYYSTTKGLLWR
jgi:hypothetical protein